MIFTILIIILSKYVIKTNLKKMKKTITLLFLLFFLVPFSESKAQCSTPTNLQVQSTGANATFTWDAVPGALSYTVDFKYISYNWTNIEYSETVTTNSLTLNDIMQSIDLHWRVIANCGTSGESSFNQANFSTPCGLPTNLSTTNITTNSATLNWQAPVELGTENTAYVFAYRPAGIGASWISLGQSSNLSFNLASLQASTTYEWCVNQLCAYYNSPPVISTFTTAALPCGVASLWLPNQITTNQANLRWLAVPNAINYEIEYKPTSAQIWSTTNTSQIEKIITGLSPATQYDWRVKAICPSNNVGVYSGIGQFTTQAVVVQPPPPVSCGTPTNFTTSNIGNKSATINWATVPNATSYIVYYNQFSNAGWLSTTVNTNTFSRTNFQFGTVYKYKVGAVCNTSTGIISPEQTFSTLNCVSAGNNSNEWIDLFSLGTINRASGADIGGYINTGLTSNLHIGSNNNQGQISAGFASNSRTQSYSIYIDFNRNGKYNDSGERVFAGGLSNGNIFSFSVSIPTSATPGLAGLRVVMSKNGQPSNGPCLENFEGETEDYLVNLVVPGSRLAVENEKITNELTENLAVFPNPSKEIFKVKVSENFKAKNYQIINLSGVIIQNKPIENLDYFELDLSNQQTGVYILRVTNYSGKQINKKLWKY
jgi:hypothetical protein